MSERVRAKITALGTYVPPRVLNNHDFEKMVETSDEWILTRTGIRERHVVDKGVATSDMATEAAKCALARRGMTPKDLDALVVATVTPDMFFPSTACLVQHKLGAQGLWGFDLSAACSAFVYALQTGAQFVMSGTHKKVMVIGSDAMSSILDYTDRATCILFGDGAGAVILEAAEDGVGLIDFEHEIDGAGGCSLYMPGGGSLNPSTHETVDKKMHFVDRHMGRRIQAAAARHEQRTGARTIDFVKIIDHPQPFIRRFKNHRTATIAENDAGRAIRVVDDRRHHIGAHHQHPLLSTALYELGSHL